MAKKKNDLFEILGERSRGGAASLVQRARDVVGGATASPKPPSKARVKAPARSGKSSGSTTRSPLNASDAPRFTSLALAAVAFTCLLLGFAFGRWSSAEAAQTGGGEDLNANRRSSTLENRGTPPSGMGGATSAAETARLNDSEIVESLSPDAFLLLPFPPLETAGGPAAAFEDGKRLVHWLRDRGFPNVRLRAMRSRRTNQDVWAVVDYLLEQSNDPDEFARLVQIESPAFAPGLSDYIAKRKVLTGLKH